MPVTVDVDQTGGDFLYTCAVLCLSLVNTILTNGTQTAAVDPATNS